MKKLIIFILTIVAMVGCRKEDIYSRADVLGTWDVEIFYNEEKFNDILIIEDFIHPIFNPHNESGITFQYEEIIFWGMDNGASFNNGIIYRLGSPGVGWGNLRIGQGYNVIELIHPEKGSVIITLTNKH